MLRNMRNDFKKYSWTLWLVIIAFILGFSLIDLFSGGKVSERVVAKVNSREIKIEDFQRQLTQVLENYKSRSKGKISKSLITQMRVPEQVLQNLINSEIIQNEAEKFNLRTTENELSDKIVNFPVFQRNGKFIGIREYKRYLAIMKTNAKDFENDLSKDILNEKLKTLITSGLLLNDSDLYKKYKNEKDSAELEYVVMTTDKVKLSKKISDDELKNYYNENKALFKSNEKRKANVIALKFDDFKKDLKIDDMKLFTYFKENKDSFLIPAKTRVYRIHLKYDKKNREAVLKKAEDLQSGLTVSNFFENAKKISEDDKAANGGDWGYSAWKSLTSQEQTIIDSLKQNEISGPVDTFDGFALLMTSEKSVERQESFDKVKGRIKSILEKEELNKIVKTKMDKIFKTLREGKDIASQYKGTVPKLVTTDFIESGQSIPEIDTFGYISRKLFSMNKNEISYPVEFIKGIAIVQMTDKKEPEIEDFLKVKNKVLIELSKVKKLAKLFTQAESVTALINRLKGEKELKKILDKRNLKLEKYTYKRGASFAGDQPSENTDMKIFSLETKKFSNPIKLKGRIAIVRVNKKTESTRLDFEKNLPDFYKKQLAEVRNNYFIAYILNKRKEYKIGLNGKLFNEIKESILARFN